MEAREFVDELKRMMDSKGRTDEMCNGVTCSNCEFEVQNRCVLANWKDFESLYKTIEIVEEWSKEHPKKTNKNVLLEKFPDAKTSANGTPTSCAGLLGIVSNCASYASCSECWNQEYKGVDIERSETE